VSVARRDRTSALSPSSREAIEELPLNGATTSCSPRCRPGMSSSPNANPTRRRSVGQLNYHGMGGRSNSYLMDAPTAGEYGGPGHVTAADSTLGVETIQEFRSSQPFSADYGRVMAALSVSFRRRARTPSTLGFEFFRTEDGAPTLRRRRPAAVHEPSVWRVVAGPW